MPKKFKGENSKAVEARARKAAVVHAEKEKRDKALEDEYWRDDDKHNAKKMQRKDDKEKKRMEQLERKKELQKLHDEEMDGIKSKASSGGSAKVTRSQIENQMTKERKAAEAAAKKADALPEEMPIEENVNRLIPTEGEARSVEDALAVLSVKEPEIDMHPEKRVKAAYQKYEDERLPQLKKENPNLRLSQLKQMLRKDWMKSPENPLNQRLMKS
ncbi:coiled-coil domain-containing protein 124-like [Ylistrum balloti]|uniref:coiled-coil domain-containing protein 124-like n=1 Tax=Ylistrum balloti TaxID=509963 RepID=UPI0029059097|nr:coiled-coil domain-containing protein 124-like [Ylistrum balloti]XP_060064060.1 coiled-coil domain-containing protein 124-like [Ylistrum balloti]